MATRFYLASSGSPAVTPSSWSAGWNKTSGVVGPFPCDTTPASTAITEAFNTALGGAGAEFIAIGRWVSAALDAQTISGSLTGVLGCFTSSVSLNATLAIAVKVIKADASDRGVLVAVSASDNTSATPPEISPSIPSTRRFQDASENTSISLSSLAVSEGDFLVIEIGYREVNTLTSRRTTIRYGDDAGSDFAHSDGLTTDLNPWVEFSGTISFYSPPAATAYTFTGPSSGTVNVASTNFTVTPNGTSTATVTPATDGSGSFTPSTVQFDGTAAAKTFTYTPTDVAGSPHTLSTSDDGGLTETSGTIDYTVNAAADSILPLVACDMRNMSDMGGMRG